ncbi:MAG: hypothetical protein AB4426_28645 [Xenococcaceae cyanobacterium]
MTKLHSPERSESARFYLLAAVIAFFIELSVDRKVFSKRAIAKRISSRGQFLMTVKTLGKILRNIKQKFGAKGKGQ